jgi:hypothetical protein
MLVAVGAAILALVTIGTWVGGDAPATSDPSVVETAGLTDRFDGGSPRGSETVGTVSLLIEASQAQGWEQPPSPVLYFGKSVSGPQDAEAAVYLTALPGQGEAVRCREILGPPTDHVSMAELAAAVAAAPGTELIDPPFTTTVGGAPAMELTVVVRDDLGCDPGYFFSWRARTSGPFWTRTKVGDTITVWIVDTSPGSGKHLFIAAETRPGTASPLADEMREIVRTIRFVREPTGPEVQDEPHPAIVDLRGRSRSGMPWMPRGSHSFSLSPDHLDLALTTPGGQLATIPADGSRPITVLDEGASAPAWSPRGDQIAFVDNPSGRAGVGPTEIFVMNTDGSQVRQLTSGTGSATSPRWAPDGSTLAYYRHGGNADGVWTVSLRTGGASRLTRVEKPPRRPGFWFGLDYAPDGSLIAFTREGDIWLMAPDGSEQRRLKLGRGRACASVCTRSLRFTPRWSPDGSKLVYTTALSRLSRWHGEQLMRVHVLDMTSGRHHELGGLTVASPPVWWSEDRLLTDVVWTETVG